jgi:hypothetical protein
MWKVHLFTAGMILILTIAWVITLYKKDINDTEGRR